MPKINRIKLNRRSVRLRGYNYASPGGYFVTICAHNRQCLFGKITDGRIVLTNSGTTAESCLLEIPEHYPNATVDTYAVMPNHVHMIINIDDDRVGARHAVPLHDATCPHGSANEKFGRPAPGSVPTIIRSYKSAVTKQCNELRKIHIRPVWQRNFYEHVIRDERELEQLREYITNNVVNWSQDEENPEV